MRTLADPATGPVSPPRGRTRAAPAPKAALP